MKKVILTLGLFLFAIVLMACQKQPETDVVAEVSNFDVTLTGVSFDVAITDSKSEITGAITISLFDKDGINIESKDYETITEIITYSKGGLKNEMTYTVKIHATVGRTLILLYEETFELASAETIHIKTIEDFMNMTKNRAGNYILDNDLDFASQTSFTSPFTSAFAGTFDGQDYTLKNITFDKLTTYTGVFGYVTTGKIQNVSFDHITIGTESKPLLMATSTRVGIVAGYLANQAAIVENVKVTNSSIFYTTSSTVQTYVGGLVGESKGQMRDVSIESSSIDIIQTSYGRLRLGGGVGHLGEEAILKKMKTDVDVTVEMKGSNLKDRDITLNIGGAIGYHNARNFSQSVEEIVAMGDITVLLDFGTTSDTTKGNYSVYVGGLAGISYSNINQAFYQGNILVAHEANLNEDHVNKYFFVGGLYGFYGSTKLSTGNLRLSTQHIIDIDVSLDVDLKASQLIASKSATSEVVTSYYGDLGLMINQVDQTANDTINKITTLDNFFTSSFVIEHLPS